MNRPSPGRDFWHSHQDDEVNDEQAKNVILRGLEIRPDRTEGNTFWDDFVAVISNNGEGASRLLGVSSDVISGWSNKIKTAVKKVREDNASDDTEMKPTGTNSSE